MDPVSYTHLDVYKRQDSYAANFGLADSLISGLKKLSVKSLSNLNPDSLYVFFNYSHPTLLQRIKAIKK